MEKAEVAWHQRISLGLLVEFSATLSIIVLVAGYIWNNTVILVAGLPVQTFTVSDYVNSGASTTVLLSAVGFISTLSYAITMPWERPLSARELRVLGYWLIGGMVVLVAAVVGFSLYQGSPAWVRGTATAAALARITAIILVFLVARRLGPLHASTSTLALVMAVGVWVTCASGAVSHAARGWQQARATDPIVHYEFEGGTLTTSDWHPLLSTQNAYYFVHRRTGEARIVPVGKLVQITQEASAGATGETARF
jgi:hypothetical protein